MGFVTILPVYLLIIATLFAIAPTINSLDPSFTTTPTTITQPRPPPLQQPQDSRAQQVQQAPLQSPIISVMLEEARQQLDDNGYTLAARQIEFTYSYLVALNNFTMFLVKDDDIKAGSAGYLSSFLLHILPNSVLTMDDLMKLPVGATFETLEPGQFLEVTTNGGTGMEAFTINGVEVEIFDLVHKDKIFGHVLSAALPRMRP